MKTIPKISLFVLALTCFRLIPNAQAVMPPPDGGYTGGNAAERQDALLHLTTGLHNAAVGFLSLKTDTTGSYNTAIGSGTLRANNSDGNTATGTFALLSNIIGRLNTANGALALLSNTNATGSNNIDIGNRGVAGESDTIRIGGNVFGFGSQTAAFIAGISGTAVVGDPVVVDGDGQLGTVASSAQFKKKIKPMDKTSEAILALKPVSFQYRSDSKGTPQFGLIAEEVAKVSPDLVVRNRNGEIYSVRYEAVNAMLLNEFLKEHRKNEEQEATVAGLKSTVARQQNAFQRT